MATIAQAIRLALRYAESELNVRNIFGQDVGPPLGGVFTATQGLESAWNTPLDERGILGTAAGLAMMDEPCVCEIQFADYLFNSLDLLRLIGNTHWSTGGQFAMPLVLMTPVGGGVHGGIYHSHSIESILSHLPGWKIVIPSTSTDAYGLMISAILDRNPVAYLIPKALMRVAGEPLYGEPPDLNQRINAPVRDRENWKPDWPDISPFTIAIGKATRRRKGDQLTIVSYGRMMRLISEALERLPGTRVTGCVDLLDLRSLHPVDLPAILESAEKTGRLLIVNEDSAQTNYGEHLLRIIQENLKLETARLLCARHLPGIGLAAPLEEYTLPTVDRICMEIEAVLPE